MENNEIVLQDEIYSLFGCLKNTVEVVGDILEDMGEIWEADSSEFLESAEI